MVYISFPAATTTYTRAAATHSERCGHCRRPRKLFQTSEGRLCRGCIDGDVSTCPDYRETPEFKNYMRAVGEIIDESGRDGITIRSIHLALGDDAQPDRTADALDMLKNVEPIGILPIRYRRI